VDIIISPQEVPNSKKHLTASTFLACFSQRVGRLYM